MLPSCISTRRSVYTCKMQNNAVTGLRLLLDREAVVEESARRQPRDEREEQVLRVLFVTRVVVVSVKVVFVMLSVKVPRPVGGAGKSADRSAESPAALVIAPSRE